MKAMIVGHPQFEVSATQSMIKTLMELSAAHYDSTCRAAGQVRGFLYGWNNRISWAVESGDTELVVSGTFREFDLTLKLCEMSWPVLVKFGSSRDIGTASFVKDNPQYVEIQEYQSFISRMLRRSNELSHWREEFVR